MYFNTHFLCNQAKFEILEKMNGHKVYMTFKAKDAIM